MVEQGIVDQASVLTLKSEITFLEVSVAKQCRCLLNSFTTVTPTPSALLPHRNEGKFLYFFFWLEACDAQTQAFYRCAGRYL